MSRKAVANWRRKYDEDNRVAEVRSPMEKGWGFCSEARIDYCATFDTWPMTVMKKSPVETSCEDQELAVKIEQRTTLGM